MKEISMLISRLIALLVIFSIVCVSGSAQFPLPLKKPDPEKEKAAAELEKNAVELLEQAVAETAALKLPENRALIYALAGDLLWTRDEKRARALFRSAGGEIIQVVNMKPEQSDSGLSEIENRRVVSQRQADVFSLRQIILRTLAERDAEMALEILQTTRAPEVAAEMQTYVMPVNAPNPAQKQAEQAPVTRNFRVEQEIRLEQGLIARAAEQDPQKAAQKIRENMEKGFSLEIISALQKIYKKDAELAAKLFEEIIQKLLAADLTKPQTNMNFAVNLLRPYAFPPKENLNAKNQPRLTMDEKSTRDIANKIADTFMKATTLNQLSALNYALPVLQKLAPVRAEQLKQKQAALRKQAPPNTRAYQFPSSLSDPNVTPEQLISEAGKAQPQMRGEFYRLAAQRAVASGDPEKVRALLQSQPDGKARNEALGFLNSNIALKLLQAGKTDEARRIIDQMPFGAAKAEQLVQLAVASYRLNTKESKENALRMMSEAHEMVKDYPEDKDETDGLVKVIAGFAVIEPERAFTMLAPVIEQANEVIGAQAVLARYNKQTRDFRDGEMIISTGFGALGAKVFRYGKELKLLAQHDFIRTRALIDQFRRDDVRLFARLFIAQSILKERIGS
jgi:hypothetical protein